jgi:hypothetical protein
MAIEIKVKSHIHNPEKNEIFLNKFAHYTEDFEKIDTYWISNKQLEIHNYHNPDNSVIRIQQQMGTG